MVGLRTIPAIEAKRAENHAVLATSFCTPPVPGWQERSAWRRWCPSRASWYGSVGPRLLR